MNKAFRSIKILAIFIFIVAFVLTFTFIPGNRQILADTAIRVFIDAGHGGYDPGATRFELKEKDVNLDIAIRLKNKLEANGFHVIMTRTSDVYYSLDERVEMANKSGADIFLSIHNNAVFSEYAHGTETYWCPNGVNGSNQFANLVQSNILQQTGRTNRGVKTANFRVIKYTTMPAALVECAFVSNPTENNLLKTADFREKCATGLYNAIKKFAQGIEQDSGDYSQSSSSEFSGFTTKIDNPENNTVVSEDFLISGWSADLKNDVPIKLEKVEFYNGKGREGNNYLGSEDTFKNVTQSSTGVIESGWQESIDIDKLDEGENIIYIYAYDGNDNYSVANIKVNVIKESQLETNFNPIADPAGPYKVAVGEELTFDGSGSSDPDGTVVKFVWKFGDGNKETGVNPVHIFNEAGEYTATLKVIDDDGAVSSTVKTKVTVEKSGSEEITEEDPEEIPDEDGEQITDFETINNSTSVIGYIDISASDLVRIFEERDSGKTKRASRLAPYYIKYGELFNIRADIAWAQMIHETGFLEFTGDVLPKQNNFAGIGATGSGVSGNNFATEELGVIAHYAHLAWYYYQDHVNAYCSDDYDPRHFGDVHSRYTGDSSLGFLNGRWAPGGTYTNKIILYANEIIEEIEGSFNNDLVSEYKVIADAGEDITAEIGEEILFDASASIISPDDVGISVKYKWNWDGDKTYDEVVDTASITHAFMKTGTFKVKLKVVAFDDIEDKDTIIVNVIKSNQAPSADTGGPYTGEEGIEITFNGSSSSDPDGAITDYEWDFGDGSTGTGISPVHTYVEAGEYILTLIVKDDNGIASEESISKVSVLAEEVNEDVAEEVNEDVDEEVDKEEIPPVVQTINADAGANMVVEVGEEVLFDASGTSISPNDADTSLAYSWDWNEDGIYDKKNLKVSEVIHTFTKPGIYVVVLRVTAFDNLEDLDTVKVTVNESIKETEEESYSVNISPITNSTNIIGYTEVTVEQLVKIFEDRNSSKLKWAIKISQLYIKYGKLFNIRADIAWAQMCHETGFLEFTGDVSPSQNNFVGIGATGGVPGNSFSNEELGIIAHFAHLAWYYYPDHINTYCSTTYDPRHFGSNHYKYTGDTSLGFLNGKWAPSATYTDKIILFANQIYDY